MKTYVYIDAFNLYFGCLKKTPYKWLDLHKLCCLLLPKHEITAIKYFTALIKSRPNDLDAPKRQQMYLRALRTIPNIEISYGHFLSHEVTMPVANPVSGNPKFVRVIKTEEKGSDVNLAVQLLHDAYQARYECAVIISGDSDLLTAIKIVMEDLKKPVGVINPQRRQCQVLLKQATFYKHINRASVLSASQFPDNFFDTRGLITKPKEW